MAAVSGFCIVEKAINNKIDLCFVLKFLQQEAFTRQPYKAHLCARRQTRFL